MGPHLGPLELEVDDLASSGEVFPQSLVPLWMELMAAQ